MPHDYETTDVLGRTVQVTINTLNTTERTLLGGGATSTETSIHHW